MAATTIRRAEFLMAYARMAANRIIENFINSYFKEGALLIRLPDGKTISVGGATDQDAKTVAVLIDTASGMKIAANPHLALGEAFMDGGLRMERGTVYDLLETITRNFKYLPRRGPIGEFRRAFMQVVTRNTPRIAKKNVAHHYDLSVDLYRRFLDTDLQYSCAYFPHKGSSLEEAQIAKKHLIAAKLLLTPGARVLDIGCGWGGLGLTLAEEYAANVAGVTLSVEQLNLAREQARARGLEQRANFMLKDYRAIEGPFDRIVSVGMFEHVGVAHYREYFETIARQLTEDGIALVHTIGRSDGPNLTSAWTEKYIFPGGYIPALSEIVPAIERAGLVITDIEVLRMHYADTLLAWRERFMAQREEIALMYDERFCRMFEFYLAGSEASFRVGASVVFQIQLAKRACVVPRTRDYLEYATRAKAEN